MCQKTINYIKSFFNKEKEFDREKQFMRTKNPSSKDIQEAYKNYKPNPKITGKNNGNYKHGMGEDYKRIRVKGKKIKISHIIWMLANKQNYIPEGFVIHHINGDKEDNNIQNLTLEDERKHMRINLKQYQIQNEQIQTTKRKS